MSTLLAVLALASEEAEASKTPFYVAGGALAVFAVLVGALGLAKPDFPSSEGASRAVMVLGTILAIAAMATTITTV